MCLPTGIAGHPVSSSSNTAPSAPYPGAPRGSRPRLQKSAHLVGVKCYLIVVRICIFHTANEAERLFIGFGAISPQRLPSSRERPVRVLDPFIYWIFLSFPY